MEDNQLHFQQNKQSCFKIISKNFKTKNKWNTIATTPGVRYIPSATKVPTAELFEH
jgi:hypothetical protein